jgi:hypothetical protein
MTYAGARPSGTTSPIHRSPTSPSPSPRTARRSASRAAPRTRPGAIMPGVALPGEDFSGGSFWVLGSFPLFSISVRDSHQQQIEKEVGLIAVLKVNIIVITGKGG